MANWSTLKAAIANIINANGNQAITGQLLQNALNNIITNVGENATFAGIATLTTNPGTPDGPVFYLATTAGVYPNFNGIEVQSGEAAILEWRGSWTKKTSGFATQEKLSELGSEVGGNNVSYNHFNGVNNGYILAEDGVAISGVNEGKSVYSNSYYKVRPYSNLKFITDYLVAVYEYDINKNFLRYNWYDEKEYYRIGDNTSYVRVGYRDDNGLTKDNFKRETCFYFDDINEEVAALNKNTTVSAFDIDKTISKVVLIENGTLQNVSNRWTTTKYDIKGIKQIKVTSKQDDTKSAVAAFFTEENVYIKEGSIAASVGYAVKSYEINVPSNAAYVLCSSSDVEPIVEISNIGNVTDKINNELVSAKKRITSLEKINASQIFITPEDVLPDYIAADGFSIIKDENRCRCDKFFGVTPDSIIIFNDLNNYNKAIYFYNSNKEYVSHIWFGNNNYIKVPKNATFVRYGFGVNYTQFETINTYLQYYHNERVVFKPYAWDVNYKTPNINTNGVITLELGATASILMNKTEVVFNEPQSLQIGAEGETTLRYLIYDFNLKELKFIAYTSFNFYSQYILGIALCDDKQLSGAWFEFEYTIDGRPSDRAVRKEVDQLRDSKLINEHKYNDLINGYYYVYNGTSIGEPNAGNTVSDSHYFRVIPNSQVKFTTNNLVAVWEYDENKNFVGHSWFGKKELYDIKNNVYYIRVGYRNLDGMTKDTFDLNTYFYNNVSKGNNDWKSLPLGRLSQRFEYHYFMGSRRSIIPPQSIHDLNCAKRLGFKSIELNVHATSDGELIVMHGSGGKFSYEVVDLNGEYTYADTAISSVTYQWIQDNLRYNSIIPKYRTKILSLEETLKEAKRIGLYVSLYMTSVDIHEKCVRLLEKYQDIPSYGVYSRGQAVKLREITKDIIGYYSMSSTLEDIIEDCEQIGAPYIHAMANEILIDSYGLTWSDEQLSEVVEEVHKRNCHLAYAACYLKEDINQHLAKLGFDYAGSGWSVNPFDSGNVLNTGYDLYANVQDWETNGEVGTYTLTLNDGNTITLKEQEYVSLGKGYLTLLFNGKVKVELGEVNVELESNGNEIVELSSYYLDNNPNLVITSIGTTEIHNFTFKLSKC